MCLCQSARGSVLAGLTIGFMTRKAMAKPKLDHLKDMLSGLVYQKRPSFYRGLDDSWYATKTVMLHIEQMQKTILLSPQDKPARGRFGRHNPLASA